MSDFKAGTIVCQDEFPPGCDPSKSQDDDPDDKPDSEPRDKCPLKGNNGVDWQPRGNLLVNDGTGPGNPGNRK
ncbi:MAG: hypothetical protein SH850_09575 [Planctomycetaceae bacterium]|nr:hypothetical protein [Planctomycetaceae bacterium]